jgi:hypothetical protein
VWVEKKKEDCSPWAYGQCRHGRNVGVASLVKPFPHACKKVFATFFRPIYTTLKQPLSLHPAPPLLRHFEDAGDVVRAIDDHSLIMRPRSHTPCAGLMPAYRDYSVPAVAAAGWQPRTRLPSPGPASCTNESTSRNFESCARSGSRMCTGAQCAESGKVAHLDDREECMCSDLASPVSVRGEASSHPNPQTTDRLQTAK